MPEPKRYPGVHQRHRRSCDRTSRCSCPWHYSAEVRVNGRRVQETKGPFASAAVAHRERVKALARMERNPVLHRGLTVEKAMRDWLDRKIKAETIRETTAVAYRQHLTAYIAPAIGSVKLAGLTVRDLDALQAWIGEHAPQVSAATRARIAATLRSFVRDAYRRGEVAEDPFRRAEPMRVKARKVQPWQPEQFARWIAWCDRQGERLAPAYRIAALTGLRRGELAGLRWVDVDTAAARIVVRQQVVQLGARTLVADPKTSSGEARVVDLDPGTVAVLEQLRFRQQIEQSEVGSAYVQTGLVLAREDGTAVTPEQITRRFIQLVRAFNAADDRIGVKIPTVRLHDLRHLSASLLLAAGVPTALVSKRLGHSSIQVTVDTYGHLIDGAGVTAATAAAALIPTTYEGS